MKSRIFTLLSIAIATFYTNNLHAQCGVTPTASITSSTNVTCFGGNNGSITVGATGGTSPYRYIFGAPQNLTCGIPFFNCSFERINRVRFAGIDNTTVCGNQTSNNYFNSTSIYGVVTAGQTHTLTVNVTSQTDNYITVWIDWNGNGNFTDIGEQYVLAAGAGNGLNTSQFSTNVTVPANVQPGWVKMRVALKWNDNSTFNACGAMNWGEIEDYKIAITQTNPTFSNLFAGNYIAYAFDANGCFGSVNHTITQGTSINPTINTINVPNCGVSDGKISVSASGGVAPYTYSWSTSFIGDTLNNVPKGNYTVTVTDNSNCTTTASIQLIQNSGLIASISHQNVLCFGDTSGLATANEFYGNPPYSYAWNNGKNTKTITGLSIGNYTVTITDSLNCTDVASVTISQPTQVVATLDSTRNVRCHGGTDGQAYLSASGGVGTFSYLWNNANYCSLTASNCSYERITFVSFAGISKLTPNCGSGYSDFSISDRANVNSGNSYNLQISIANYQNEFLNVYIDWNNDGDFDDFNEVIVMASGSSNTSFSTLVTVPSGLSSAAVRMRVALRFGSAPLVCGSYTYGDVQDYTVIIGTAGSFATSLAAGTYSVIAVDQNGCSAAVPVTISQPDELEGTITNVTDVSCNGGDNGSATAAGNGGTPPYAYVWSNGVVAQIGIGFEEGNYTVTVSDINGCADVLAFYVDEPDTFEVYLANYKDLSCNNGSDGEIELDVYGGTIPYSYLWSNGFTTKNAYGVKAGKFKVVATDAKGCKDSLEYTLTEPRAITVNFDIIHESSCGAFNGIATANVAGGIMPYTFIWGEADSNKNTSNLAYGTYNGLGAGTHNLLIVDGNDCSSLNQFNILCPLGMEYVNTDRLSITVYPNPNAGLFNITLPQVNVESGYTVSLYNLSGQLVYLKEFRNDVNNNRLIEIEASFLTKGIYTLNVQSTNTSFVNKVVIQ
jgi:hypothetical protein